MCVRVSVTVYAAGFECRRRTLHVRLRRRMNGSIVRPPSDCPPMIVGIEAEDASHGESLGRGQQGWSRPPSPWTKEWHDAMKF